MVEANETTLNGHTTNGQTPNIPTNLGGKVALVTGASRGIGAGIVRFTWTDLTYILIVFRPSNSLHAKHPLLSTMSKAKTPPIAL